MRQLLRSTIVGLRRISRMQRAYVEDVASARQRFTTPLLRSIFSWQRSGTGRVEQPVKHADAWREMSGTATTVAARSEIDPHHQISFDTKRVYVPWSKGVTSTYHNIWLRDSCQCSACFHPVTKQRLLNTFAIPEDIKPENAEASDSGLNIKWDNDGHRSFYPWDWLHLHSYQPILEKTQTYQRFLWGRDEIVENPPVVEYADVMASDAGVAEWTSKVKMYGFCFVEGTPVSPEATEELINRISFARNTHYGGFWDFTSDLSKADTAYTDLPLGLHTDGTYFTDPPGLQLLHCLYHDGNGGESILADGFRAARILREESPEHYKTLSRVRVPAHSAGNEDVCIRPTFSARPILNHDDVSGELLQVRWNNDDRSTMDRWSSVDPDGGVLQFYDAIRKWNQILSRPEVEYRFKLMPGRPMIFDNWRVMHGRTQFDGKRRLCGAYINMDDFESRMRLTNMGRDAVLRQL